MLAAILWSTSGVFVRNIDLPAMQIAAYRSLAAGVVLMALVFCLRAPKSFDSRMLLMIACFAAMNLLFITSMTLTTAANTVFLQYTAPFWMFLASVFLLKEPTDRASGWTLAGAMLGIGVLIAGQWGAGGENKTGIVTGLASGVAFAAVCIFMRVLRRHDPLWLATVNHLGAGIILLTILQFTSSGPMGGRPTLREWMLLTVFGVGQMALPYVFCGRGLRSITPREAGVILLLEPLLNPLWTFLSVGERPATPTLVGGGILLTMLAIRYLPGPAYLREAWRQRGVMVGKKRTEKAEV